LVRRNDPRAGNKIINIKLNRENKIRFRKKQKLTKNAILLATTVLALLASPGVVLATDCTPQTTWIDSAGSWFTCSNWSNNTCPDSGTSALINNGGTAQITASLPVANACALSLGPNAGDSGKVTVSIGTLQVTTSVVVGNHGTGSLSVTNGGTLTGGDTYVGGTAATDGTGLLTLSDTSTVTASSVQVNATGTLSGNGTVSVNSGSGTATVDGTLAPNWTLTITGNLLLDSPATTQCDVTPDNLGSIDADVSGTATLDGRLLVTMTGTFTPGTRFTLLHTTGGRGFTKFSSQSIKYPTGQGFTPTITYDANHVYLCLVPNGGISCD
jgi:T5SS/PEP-CTERM-associated repeat protein